MEKKIRIIHYGMGTIGSSIAKLLQQKPAVQVVGALDINPEKVGKDVGRVIGLDHDLGVVVQKDFKSAVPSDGADIVLHSTRSMLPEVAPQLHECMQAGLHVISTCEELVYPFHIYPKLSRELDDHARERRVVLLGTGVNPGFAMDKLMMTLATACQKVDKVRILRVVDASRRRLRLQKKAGVGLTLQEFHEELETGSVGNYGMKSSAWMLADQLGIAVDRVDEAIAPIVAEIPMRSQYLDVKAGEVKGIKQVALGMRGDEEYIRLELEIYLGAAESLDAVRIAGVPNLDMKIEGGIHGDIATTAIAVNCIPAVFRLKPGLRVAHDVSMSYWPGEMKAMHAAG